MLLLWKRAKKFVFVKNHLAFILALIVLFGQPSFSARASDVSVVPINWKSFGDFHPLDRQGLQVKEILINANKYALKTWWQKRGYAGQKGLYLNFFGNAEDNIRPVADEAFSLAVSLKTDAYDAKTTGVTKSIAEQILKKMVVSLAFRHKATTKDGWGNSWQSALWANRAGHAGWLIWDNLSAVEKKYVQDMVVYEANRFNTYSVPYYRGPDGKLNYPGDTKAEENAWNSAILQLATAMMPNHPNKEIWRGKMLQLMISAFARPLDVKSREVVDGKTLAQWLKGSNIANDGTLVNRDRLNPDYMTTVSLNIQTALVYSLARLPVPKAAFFNADIVYKALSDGSFFNTHIYQNGSAKIGYPRGNTWGVSRRMNFALLDLEASVFGFDHLAAKKGNYWADLHISAVRQMQQRSATGQTYLYAKEDKYQGREEWVAELAGEAYLVKWLQSQGAFAK